MAEHGDPGDIRLHADRDVREQLYSAQRALHRRLVAIALVASVVCTGLLLWVLWTVRGLVVNESVTVEQHRERNELLHDAICQRQGELARSLHVELTPCPTPLDLRHGRR